MLLPVLALLALASSPQAAQASYCDSIVPRVERCVNNAPRDLLFIVDGSNSMQETKFRMEMIDYTQSLYCAFDPDAANSAGMIVFNNLVSVVIEQAVYTPDEWLVKTEEVRSNPDSCCTCCTPTAEAFDMAKDILSLTTNPFKIAFVITDGVPSNNLAGSPGGKPQWWYYAPVGNKASIGFNPAQYNAQIVGQRAAQLKKVARLMIVGVPNKFNKAPDVDFFAGEGKYEKSGVPVTITRDQKKWTYKYQRPPNPIVSVPVIKNAFSSSTWEVSQLVNQTVNSMCEVTRVPTMFPTTNYPTKTPTRAPSSKTPTKRPTKAPTKRPTTNKPTLRPSQSPTRFFFEQVDLTFVIDRSKSMIWQNSFCQGVVDALPEVFPPGTGQSSSACWELFMRYILQQSDEVAAIDNAGRNADRALGWASGFGGTAGKGLRVQVIGFACENNQKTPKMYDYTDVYNGNKPVTSRASLLNILNKIRVNITPFGGTCPGLSIEQSVKYVERSPFSVFPYQSVILVTDGVFFDLPHPARATTGLEAYNVLRFSVGIAVAEGSNTYGMTPKEIATQSGQLAAFASSADTYLNLGTLGWRTLLQDVSQSIRRAIAVKGPTMMLKPPTARYTWCGWRRNVNCKSDAQRNGKCRWPNAGAKEWGCKKK